MWAILWCISQLAKYCPGIKHQVSVVLYLLFVGISFADNSHLYTAVKNVVRWDIFQAHLSLCVEIFDSDYTMWSYLLDKKQWMLSSFWNVKSNLWLQIFVLFPIPAVQSIGIVTVSHATHEQIWTQCHTGIFFSLKGKFN